MEELVPYFCKMALVTNGDLFLHGLARHVLIRIEILTILAFKLCMICLRLAAPELFFSGSKLFTQFCPYRHQRFWRESAIHVDHAAFVYKQNFSF
jgi:uncharacterized protein involved in response to NO